MISELPYQLALDQPIPPHFAASNVFFTLFAGAVCCEIVKFCRSKGRGWAAVFPVAAIVLLCEMAATDYGGFGVLFVLMPYLFFENKIARLVALGLVTAFCYIVVTQFYGVSSGLAWMGICLVLVHGPADGVRSSGRGNGGTLQWSAWQPQRKVVLLHLLSRSSDGAFPFGLRPLRAYILVLVSVVRRLKP